MQSAREDVAVPPAAVAPQNPSAVGNRDAEGSYTVGWCKPPVETQFKKGQSGNPRGRRRKSTNIDTILEEELAEKVTVKRPDGTARYITKRQAIVKRIVDDAIKGNNKPLVYLFQMLQRRGEPDPFTIQPTDEAELQRLARQLGAPVADVDGSGA